ncbi:hypothetical protein V3H47_08570 [Vibrio parahaemolyticus]|uniref:hypothetical protein n=1 Tax=Vibrio TaxID=662 RepID=UPI00132F34A5|nr:MULTISPECIES: hypothetical protein [Vibrio]MBE3696769.1 hypothetical protein [Vibrio parahaemolyticus]MBE3775906.1 hypothetical protein [Vibrio parahaemolyticus]MBN8112615.1 hypothetical protein [Vibrio vulnificus]QHH01513.1 hypothetical protein EHC64_20720 [Vibrio parahaemolyticus]QHH06626.1 hypothetical protein EHC66_20315 [Vibrio parahaemolyticus]
MRVISKAAYQDVLLVQLDYLNKKEGTHPDDLKALASAYEASKKQRFEKVEVIESNGVYTFKPIFTEN